MSASDDVTDSKTKNCPYCGAELRALAMQCRHCRRWMPDVDGPERHDDEPTVRHEASYAEADVAAPRTVAQAGPAGTTVDASQESPGQNPVHLVILTVISLGLYEFYWIWRGWSALKSETDADISPGWRTAAFLIPFVNVMVLYFLLRDTKELAERRGVAADYSPGTLTAMFYALRLLGNAALVGGAPLAWLAGMATVLPLLPVQVVWNAYWKKTRPSADIRVSLNPSELAIAVLAGLLVMMVAALLATGADPVSLPG